MLTRNQFSIRKNQVSEVTLQTVDLFCNFKHVKEDQKVQRNLN